jgi:hypothetical protein
MVEKLDVKILTHLRALNKQNTKKLFLDCRLYVSVRARVFSVWTIGQILLIFALLFVRQRLVLGEYGRFSPRGREPFR